VKGLTGIDIPALLGGSLPASAGGGGARREHGTGNGNGGPPAAPPPAPRTRRGGSGANAGASGPVDPDAAMARASETISGAGASPAMPNIPPPTGGPSSARLEAAGRKLAADLGAVSGVDRYLDTRLDDLERTGSPSIRSVWRAAREQLAERYGNLTIRELLDRYSGREGRGAKT